MLASVGAPDERQAFGWAVRSLRLYDWKSDQPRFQVNGDSLTIRELCERAKKLDEPQQRYIFAVMGLTRLWERRCLFGIVWV